MSSICECVVLELNLEGKMDVASSSPLERKRGLGGKKTLAPPVLCKLVSHPRVSVEECPILCVGLC